MESGKKTKNEKLEQIDNSIRQILTSAQQIFSKVDHALKNNELLPKDVRDLVTNIYKAVDGMDLLLQETQEIRRKKEEHLNNLKKYTMQIENLIKPSEETHESLILPYESLMEIPYYTIFIEQLISRFGYNLPIEYNLLVPIVEKKYKNWKETIRQHKQHYYIV